ncbi:Phosphoribosylformylglycinamidine synthase [Fundidesulfovibrio magnetotacticus]|uniref:Phosphoribosylformylglycinamidine synthase n=1 Tax=Fundidesulfovibrio magnetotacticus TaxID=2730080 RepID=A0A6V8M408_9BACT|nr:phosphoribosylformylglycinamidine synthase subunit PurQ [Fundidesulfovibrio magnetotacticus]GFK95135.1 Phosphoribosylformylglycinamidine synthase [Fundidesulfovibrio magnetotacticus]
MALVKTLVVTGFGTNCESESAHAARLAGSDQTDIVYFSDITAGRVDLPGYNFLIFPGGFLDGDDLGAGQAGAIRWKFAATKDGTPLLELLRAFLDRGGLVLGICNGFQLLVKLGLLPALDKKYFERQVTLSNNDSGRFEDRWVKVRVNRASPCVFTKDIEHLDLPVRHGEGMIIPQDNATLSRIVTENLIALQYADPASGLPTMEYPYNPNGSPMAIAGLTDPSGRILGLMPHPEAFNDPTNHPGWTRGERPSLGIALLENAVRHLKGNA